MFSIYKITWHTSHYLKSTEANKTINKREDTEDENTQERWYGNSVVFAPGLSPAEYVRRRRANFLTSSLVARLAA